MKFPWLCFLLSQTTFFILFPQNDSLAFKSPHSIEQLSNSLPFKNQLSVKCALFDCYKVSSRLIFI